MSRDAIIKTIGQVFEITPVLTNFATPYTANDQVGGINTISEAFQLYNPKSVIQSVTVIDKAKQNAALELYFFDELPTVASSDNAAMDVSDAEMADKCLGFVEVPAANYKTLANNSVGVAISAMNLLLKAAQTSTTISKLYMVARTSGTPTYGSISDLVIKLGIIQL